MAKYKKIAFPAEENFEKRTPVPEDEQLFQRTEKGREDEFYFKSHIIAKMKYNRWDLINIKKTGFFGIPHCAPVLPFKRPKDDWSKNLTQKLRLQQKRLEKWKLLQSIMLIKETKKYLRLSIPNN